MCMDGKRDFCLPGLEDVDSDPKLWFPHRCCKSGSIYTSSRGTETRISLKFQTKENAFGQMLDQRTVVTEPRPAGCRVWFKDE